MIEKSRVVKLRLIGYPVTVDYLTRRLRMFFTILDESRDYKAKNGRVRRYVTIKV